MNYKIITQKEKLESFIEWLPDLKPNEKFYVCLFARKKYTPGEIKGPDKSQLKRFLSDKERLYDKIMQLEVPLGSYRLRHGEVLQQSLALYINPNPRDLKQATYESIMNLTRLLKDDNKSFNPHSEVMTCIQKSSGKKEFIDFDIDTKDFDFEKLYTIINPDCLTIIETHGGFHVLVKLDMVEPQFKKTFYNDLIKMEVDQVGDQLLPVPGCTQGGFTPRFIKK